MLHWLNAANHERWSLDETKDYFIVEDKVGLKIEGYEHIDNVLNFNFPFLSAYLTVFYVNMLSARKILEIHFIWRHSSGKEKKLYATHVAAILLSVVWMYT